MLYGTSRVHGASFAEECGVADRLAEAIPKSDDVQKRGRVPGRKDELSVMRCWWGRVVAMGVIGHCCCKYERHLARNRGDSAWLCMFIF